MALPAWLARWPRGLRPEAVYLREGRVEFLYQAPQERWFLVGLSPPAKVSERWGPDATDLKRLAHAVRRQLRKSPEAIRWLEATVQFHRTLRSLPSLGGMEPCEPALAAADALLTRSAEHSTRRSRAKRASRVTGTGFGGCAPKKHRADESTVPPPAVADADELRWGLLLAAGRFAEALGCVPSERGDRSARVVGALRAALCGDVSAARSLAMAAADDGGAPGAFESAQLLDRLGHRNDAIDCLVRALPLSEGRRDLAFRRAHHVARMAATSRNRSAAMRAAEVMEETAQSADELLACAEARIAAGDFRRAETTLQSLLRAPSDETNHDRVALVLATLLLWRNAPKDARDLLAPRVEGAPSSHLHRLRGAAHHVCGEPDLALEHLEHALRLDPDDQHARLWRAEVLGALGRLDEACLAICEVSLGDQVAWQLVRALLEEERTPGRRVRDRNWFIVDELLRALLQAAAPPSEPTHAEALKALRQALSLLGGNRSETITTVRGGVLRWEDGLSSSRRRAEQLQETLLRRPVEDVLAEFQELASAHPNVPFYQTYAAEILLWLGDYERAYELFGRLWRETRTRWGYVGYGAAALFLGEHELALAHWREGLEDYTYLEAEATYCYRGELFLARGDLDAAEADLSRAVQAQPARLGAWIDFALLQQERARPDRVAEAIAHIESLAPAFWWSAREGRSSTIEALHTLRAQMRGNRASAMYSRIDEAGGFRIVGTGAPRRIQEAAREQLDVLEEGFLARLVDAAGSR